MQKLFIIIMLVVFNQLAFSQTGTPTGSPPAYVKLDGKQFKLNGNDFYPLICNYNIGRTFNINRTGTPTNFYATPTSAYGGTGDYECYDLTSCNLQFQDHFSKIVSMGFNTIRVDIAVSYRGTTAIPSTQRYFTVSYDENMGPGNQWQTNIRSYDLDMTSNFNDANSTTHFNIIKNLLTQAEIANLKVILVCGEGFSDNGNRIMWQTYDFQAATDFASYLRKLASEINSYPSLLAYDFINEPIYQGMYKDVAGDVLKKQTICEYVNMWVDAVHQYDNNHLITIGSAIIDEVLYFDPGIMKLDFYSAHLYTKGNPMYPNYNVLGDHGIQNGFERFDIISYWMSQTYPMPWIIGETGFSADDNNVNPIYPKIFSNDPAWYVPPYMFGSEQQQYNYAQHSLAVTRNASASGYAWWAFQNVFWNDLNSDPKYYQENFFGLLHYGDKTTNTWYNKPAVSVFQSYLNGAGQPPAVVPLAQPPHYYDPYEIAANCSTCVLKKVQGKVIDQKGNNVENAVVRGSSWLKTEIVTSPSPKTNYYHDVSYSFSVPNGDFTVIPYNYDPSIGTNDPHRIVSIEITAVGAERIRIGPDYPYYDQSLTTPVGTYILKKTINGYDALVKNETVIVNEVRNYYGRNTLTTNNVILNGKSELTARKEVHITSGFSSHASLNNETHLFISDAFPDCPIDFNNYSRITSITSSESKSYTSEFKEIELEFQSITKLLCDVSPNPSNGTFNLSVKNPKEDKINISITNLVGEKIVTLNSEQNYLTFNLNYLAKGIYYLQINNSEEFITKKVIIN